MHRLDYHALGFNFQIPLTDAFESNLSQIFDIVFHFIFLNLAQWGRTNIVYGDEFEIMVLFCR
jgi:hypothetical protein